MSRESTVDARVERGPGTAESSPVRVLVADDHPAMRRALARLVDEHDGLQLVGEAGDGEHAAELIGELAPDVALLDVRMPKLDGLSLLRRQRAEGSGVRFLLISGTDDPEIAHEAISQGAAGFLSKDAEEAEISDAILAVAAGRSVLSTSLQSDVLDLIRDRPTGSVTLSGRERELLELAADGLTTGEIADRLCLSPNTVKTYWQRLYEKLGTNDRASAVAEAIRRGLLQVTEGRPDTQPLALPLAVLRASLLAVIFVSEQLIDARQLTDDVYFTVLGLATAYAGAGLVQATWSRRRAVPRFAVWSQPALDIAFLSALAATSGGAFSDVRKAFFVIPLAAAFSERPRATAKWSLVAVLAFTIQAVVAGGHPAGAHNTWQRLTIDQDLYLVWTGVAGTMLALALRRRSERTEELARGRQQLVMHAIDSVERERTRLADALHDSPVQNLIAARHDVRRAQRTGDRASFERLNEAIDVTIAELREEIFNLHPHVLDHVGLSAALEQVARRHAAEPGLSVTVDIDAGASAAHREVLFALGRELLGNAARYAGATQIRLTVERGDTRIRLTVADDGCGIPDGRLQQALLEGHIGLASIRERASALGGAVAILTAPGHGTSVTVTLPISAPAAPADRVAISAGLAPTRAG